MWVLGEIRMLLRMRAAWHGAKNVRGLVNFPITEGAKVMRWKRECAPGPTFIAKIVGED
jgi:hypothetical protein